MIKSVASAISVLWNCIRLTSTRNASRGEIEQTRFELLQACVRLALERVPYYRELGLNPESGMVIPQDLESFRRLPLVSKEIVKSRFPDGMVVEGLDWDRLYSVATSGTTDRLMLFVAEDRRNWDRAADLLIELRANGFRPGHRSLSLPPDACYEHCGADGRMVTHSVAETFRDWWNAPPGGKLQMSRRLRGAVLSEYVWRSKQLPSLGVDGTAANSKLLEDYSREIRKWKPQVLRGLPVTLYVLALHAMRDGYDFPEIRIVRPSGGKFSEAMIETVERAFGARVRENYGTAELGSMAMDCAHCRDQHLFEGIFHLEILRHGEPVPPGEVGELVVTDLRNLVTPLIRYRVGDVGRLRSGPCACGFEGTRFVVDGRMEETVVTPEGRVVTGMELVDLFLRQPGIDHVRILQEADDLFIAEVVTAPGGDLPEAAGMESKLGELLGHPVRLRMRKVRRVAPERNGKYRLVLSNSHCRFNQALGKE
jgi:phenylacetate-CoA ligase